ncbi:MAG: hypothetical protein AAF414_12055 [Pseudomonadota bacterium]
MSIWTFVSLFALAYIILLARSAWKQGEVRQFLWSLAAFAALAAILAAFVGLYAWLFGA